MAETDRTARLDAIRETLREPLLVLVQQLQTRLGNNLKSVTVVGSALTDDFQPGSSDINTVVLLDRHDVGVAQCRRLPGQAAEQAQALGAAADDALLHRAIARRFRRGVPRLSTDARDDPRRGSRSPRSTSRSPTSGSSASGSSRPCSSGCDRATSPPRATRNSSATFSSPRPRAWPRVARAMLWLNDVERPRTMDAALKKAAARFHVDLDAVIAAERWRYTKPRLTQADVESGFRGHSRRRRPPDHNHR